MIPIRGLRAPVAPHSAGRHSEKPRPRRYWSEREDTELARLWNAGVPVSAIAEAMGESKGAVMGRVHRKDLPRRRNPVEVLDAAE